MAQTKKLGTTATNVRTEGNRTIVRYRDTDVVSFDDSIIELNTGGWFTNTTKARMNQASTQFALGFHVYQEKKAWGVRVPGALPASVLTQFDGHRLTFSRLKVKP